MAVTSVWFVKDTALSADAPTSTGCVGALDFSSQQPALQVEPAGRSYWSFVNRGRSIDSKKLANVSALSTAPTKDASSKDGGGGEEVAFQLRDDLTADNIGDCTYYELLGFDKYGTGVNEDSLKKAYRKAVLKYHPDKVGAGVADEGEEDEVFISMQKAYDTLTDLTKRRAYDSSLEFDDTIPDESAGKGEDFFEVSSHIENLNHFARTEIVCR
jgi:DnaJ domain